jgi:hypothetical protein
VRRLLLVILAVSAAALPLRADEATEQPKHGFVHKLLLYIPNRVLDALDMVRCRVRVGPGLALDVRATEYADVFIGTYASVYAGLPGPRMRKTPHLPVGIESLSGIEVSVADLSAGAGFGPDYSSTEIGVGIQALIVGADVGVDPMEIIDFIGGLFLLDPRRDDF